MNPISDLSDLEVLSCTSCSPIQPGYPGITKDLGELLLHSISRESLANVNTYLYVRCLAASGAQSRFPPPLPGYLLVYNHHIGLPHFVVMKVNFEDQ